MIDLKVVEKIQKLLRLGRDGGATEAEANSAMAKAEELMLANNLSMAQMELGGEAAERRLKENTKGKANYRWQRWLMAAVADANFCHLIVITGTRTIRWGATREISLGYDVIGRVSNVTACRHMYDYLLQTCARMRAEYEMLPGNGTKEGALFIEGLAFRLSERVKERHEAALRKQREEAEAKKREEAARASHPAAAPSSNALVVVLEDFAQMERDLNNDLVEGWEPGTTLARRQAEDVKRAERAAEYAKQEQRIKDLMKEHGVEYGIAWNMVHLNHTLDRAKEYQTEWENRGEKTSRRGGYRGGRTREDRLRDRLYTSAASDGKRAANDVSLNQQVSSNTTKVIS